MQSEITSLSSFDLLFADFIQEKLELQGDKVLISFSEEGQKSSKINENICYVKTFIEQDQVSLFKNRGKEYDSKTEQVTFTQSAMRTLMLQVVFYGPDSDRLCTLLNELVYTNNSKEFFYKNGLALIPDRTSFPYFTKEMVNSRWWNRADLKLHFYNSVVVKEVTPIIDGYNIIIKTDKLEGST